MNLRAALDRVPLLGLCWDTIRLRLSLPRRLESESLDLLLDDLLKFRPTCRAPTRAKLDRSIQVAEALLARIRLAPNTCLHRSMCRYALLRSHDISARFCMGLPTSASEETTGHAWVEDEAGPYGETIDDGAYAVTYCHPEPPEPADRPSGLDKVVAKKSTLG